MYHEINERTIRPTYRAVLAYRGGQGSEIVSFTSLPNIGEILWLIPPSHRAHLQATRSRSRANPRSQGIEGLGDQERGGKFNTLPLPPFYPIEHIPYEVVETTAMRDGTPRLYLVEADWQVRANTFEELAHEINAGLTMTIEEFGYAT